MIVHILKYFLTNFHYGITTSDLENKCTFDIPMVAMLTHIPVKSCILVNHVRYHQEHLVVYCLRKAASCLEKGLETLKHALRIFQSLAQS